MDLTFVVGLVPVPEEETTKQRCACNVTFPRPLLDTAYAFIGVFISREESSSFACLLARLHVCALL